jgi:hypothetical protein
MTELARPCMIRRFGCFVFPRAGTRNSSLSRRRSARGGVVLVLTPPTLGTLVLPLGAALPRRLYKLWLCGFNTTRILAWHDLKPWLESFSILSERGRDRRGLE